MNDWQSAFVETNGIQLHYHRTGGASSGKPPLVLAHGITDNGLCWSRLARELENEYDLILVDARGHGLSDKPESGYAPSDHAADLAGLIQRLDIAPAVIIGHSMGGSTATALGAAYPQLVRALIVEDPAWRAGNATDAELEARAAEWRANIVANAQRSLAEIEQAGRERSPLWAAQEFPAWAQAKQQVSPNVTQMVTSRRGDWREKVAQFQCPVLLITGDVAQGGIVSPEAAAQAQAANERVQVAHIPGAGHNIRRDQFGPFVAVVREFLQSL